MPGEYAELPAFGGKNHPEPTPGRVEAGSEGASRDTLVGVPGEGWVPSGTAPSGTGEGTDILPSAWRAEAVAGGPLTERRDGASGKVRESEADERPLLSAVLSRVAAGAWLRCGVLAAEVRGLAGGRPAPGAGTYGRGGGGGGCTFGGGRRGGEGTGVGIPEEVCCTAVIRVAGADSKAADDCSMEA